MNNILDHEIPQNTRLYFAQSAKLKREIEYKAATILEDNDFEEIVTPFFSYHKSRALGSADVIRVNDENNRNIILRADSTFDVAKIVTQRLDIKQNKWFYIQPVFRYPAKEIYQIGAEWIGERQSDKVINIASTILQSLQIDTNLQISNISIPKLISEKLGIDIEMFKHGFVDDISEEEWFRKLTLVTTIQDLKNIDIPSFLTDEVNKLIDIASKVQHQNIIITPLYFSKLKYYDGMFFRFLKDNDVYCKGGHYKSDEIDANGFAIYVDDVIEKLMDDK